jgi:hypothetical protein
VSKILDTPHLFGYGQVVNACVMGVNTYLDEPTNAGRLMLDVRAQQVPWFVTGRSYGEVLLSWAGTDLYDPDALQKVYDMCAS